MHVNWWTGKSVKINHWIGKECGSLSTGGRKGQTKWQLADKTERKNRQKFGRALHKHLHACNAYVWSFRMINWVKWNWSTSSALLFCISTRNKTEFTIHEFVCEFNFSFWHDGRWLTSLPSAADAVGDSEWEHCSFTYQSEWNYCKSRVNYNNDSLASATHLCHARLNCSPLKTIFVAFLLFVKWVICLEDQCTQFQFVSSFGAHKIVGISPHFNVVLERN